MPPEAWHRPIRSIVLHSGATLELQSGAYETVKKHAQSLEFSYTDAQPEQGSAAIAREFAQSQRALYTTARPLLAPYMHLLNLRATPAPPWQDQSLSITFSYEEGF